MKTLHNTLGMIVLLGTVGLSAHAQELKVMTEGLETVVGKTGEISTTINNALARTVGETQMGFRQTFPDIGVGIRDNEELTVTPLNFKRGATGNVYVGYFPMMDRYATAAPERVKKGTSIGVPEEPAFVPFDRTQKVVRVGMKEFFSATPAESPAWIGLFGLNHCVGLAMISKSGDQVLRVSVAHIDGNTKIGEGQSSNFFKQAVDKEATSVDVYLLADRSQYNIVQQLKNRLTELELPRPLYYVQLNGVPQFAVNTATGQISQDVAFPRDLNWTPENELHFNAELNNVLVPAELSPSPAMEAVMLRQRPQHISGPVRESFPEEGVEIVNDADLTLRPIGGAENTPTVSSTQLPWRGGSVTLDNVQNVPIREYFPGMGYILDDADGTFVPER